MKALAVVSSLFVFYSPAIFILVSVSFNSFFLPQKLSPALSSTLMVLFLALGLLILKSRSGI